MDLETETIIDSNGTKYRVGLDQHGWLTIQHVKLGPVHEGTTDTVEYDGETWGVQPVGEYPNFSFNTVGMQQLRDAIEDALKRT